MLALYSSRGVWCSIIFSCIHANSVLCNYRWEWLNWYFLNNSGLQQMVCTIFHHQGQIRAYTLQYTINTPHTHQQGLVVGNIKETKRFSHPAPADPPPHPLFSALHSEQKEWVWTGLSATVTAPYLLVKSLPLLHQVSFTWLLLCWSICGLGTISSHWTSGSAAEITWVEVHSDRKNDGQVVNLYLAVFTASLTRGSNSGVTTSALLWKDLLYK